MESNARANGLQWKWENGCGSCDVLIEGTSKIDLQCIRVRKKKRIGELLFPTASVYKGTNFTRAGVWG